MGPHIVLAKITFKKLYLLIIDFFKKNYSFQYGDVESTSHIMCSHMGMKINEIDLPIPMLFVFF